MHSECGTTEVGGGVGGCAVMVVAPSASGDGDATGVRAPVIAASSNMNYDPRVPSAALGEYTASKVQPEHGIRSMCGILYGGSPGVRNMKTAAHTSNGGYVPQGGSLAIR